MTDKQNDLVMLTKGHIVLFDDIGKLTVLERVSHRVVYYGVPSGTHPISVAARRVLELAEAGQLPDSFPIWEPYPYDKPTIENFALYEVQPGVLPSRETFLYFRDVLRRVKNRGRTHHRK